MSIRLYMDVHVRRAVTVGLRLRDVDVVTAQEDEATRLPDPELLDRATALDRVLFSQDADLLREASSRQRRRQHFSGLVYGYQLFTTIRQCIDDLELLAKANEPADFADRVEYLPLK